MSASICHASIRCVEKQGCQRSDQTLFSVFQGPQGADGKAGQKVSSVLNSLFWFIHVLRKHDLLDSTWAYCYANMRISYSKLQRTPQKTKHAYPPTHKCLSCTQPPTSLEYPYLPGHACANHPFPNKAQHLHSKICSLITIKSLQDLSFICQLAATSCRFIFISSLFYCSPSREIQDILAPKEKRSAVCFFVTYF